jgi:cytochrome c
VIRIRNVLIGCALAIVTSLALARVHPFGDAGLYTAKSTRTPMLNGSQLPFAVRAILVEKCSGCHSMQTRSPAYGRFAPASWLMERDVVGARKAMNLSLWDTYSPELQQILLAKIVHEAKAHEMPPVQYRIIHWNARITDADLKTLDQLPHARDSAQTDASSPGQGDPTRGKALFEKRCTGCHTLTQNREGPRLQGVYGRPSGTAEGFAYSAALKNARIVWDDQSLDRWLTDPDAFIAGNEMDFLVSRPQERRDLISYLKQSSAK